MKRLALGIALLALVGCGGSGGSVSGAFILSPKMRLRLLLVVMVIALVLTRSRMGNAAFFAAMLIVGSIAIVLASKTAPKTIALIASDYGLLGLGLQ